jgi:hypothetical protein
MLKLAEASLEMGMHAMVGFINEITTFRDSCANKELGK